MHRRYEYFEALAPLLHDEVVVTNLGVSANEWQAIRPHDANLYAVGMALVTPIALGLAMSIPETRVFSLDADGSIAMEMSILATVGKLRPRNLTMIVLNNKSYESIGNFPTDTAHTLDIVGVAKACGLKNSFDVLDVSSFEGKVKEAMNSSEPFVICADAEPGTYPSGPPPITTIYGRANKFRFIEFVEKKKGIRIIKRAAK